MRTRWTGVLLLCVGLGCGSNATVVDAGAQDSGIFLAEAGPLRFPEDVVTDVPNYDGGCAPDLTMCTNGCTDTTSDPSNCSACGMACTLPNAYSGCNASACVIGGCYPGYANCNSMEPDGCEINTATDVSNCGTCGHACSAGLACINGGCLGAAAADAGTDVPPVDTGVDVPPVDTGVDVPPVDTGVDAGTPPPADAGTPPATDAGIDVGAIVDAMLTEV